jgi:hypothetical protein
MSFHQCSKSVREYLTVKKKLPENRMCSATGLPGWTLRTGFLSFRTGCLGPGSPAGIHAALEQCLVEIDSKRRK